MVVDSRLEEDEITGSFSTVSEDCSPFSDLLSSENRQASLRFRGFCILLKRAAERDVDVLLNWLVVGAVDKLQVVCSDGINNRQERYEYR
jgi:hypothetical protein